MNNHQRAHLHYGPPTRLGHGSGSSVQKPFDLEPSPLKNAVFRALWLACLLSGSAVAGARDGRDLADEHVDSGAAPYLSNVDCCYFAFLPLHASCGSNRRHIRSKEAALFDESLVGDCGRRPADRYPVRVCESLAFPHSACRSFSEKLRLGSNSKGVSEG